jgi:LAGLIDADG-like domain
MVDVDVNRVARLATGTMRHALDTIDAATLRDLYVEQKLTAARIATRFGCTARTILRRLRRAGFRTRPPGPVPRRTTPPAWSAKAAYAVGLMATDGNLSPDGRHMSFVSQDRELVETFIECLGLTTAVRTLRTRAGGILCRAQWADRRIYDWFISLGLFPAKSRRLGQLAIPDECYADFVRGCIDGDGSVHVYADRHHRSKNDRYVYERLYVSLVSASLAFLEWIKSSVTRLVGVTGAIHEHRHPGRRATWDLRYAKADSIKLIRWMHYDPDVPALLRKRTKAAPFLSALGSCPARSVGRPRVGWLYNTDATGSAAREYLGRGGETGDSRRSKRRARKGVRVQIPPPVPTPTTPSLTTPGPGRYRGRSVGL